MKNIKNIFGFETFLVVFLFSYQIKNTPFFENLPDLTTALAFILLPWGFWICKREGNLKEFYENKTLLWFLFFSFWMLLSYFWSPQTFFSKSKLIVHVFFTVPLVFYGALIIAPSSQRLKRLFITFVMFSLPVLFQVFHLFFMEKGIYVGTFVFGANYLITGQTLGISLIILYVYALDAMAENNPKKALLYIGVSSLIAFAMLHTGGRGPLIAISLSLLLTTLLYKREKNFSSRFLPLIGITLLVILQHFVFHFLGMAKKSPTLERLLNTYDSSRNIIDQSSALRLDYYTSAWQAFQDNILIGLGIAGWPTYFGAEKINSHPHNIFLEIAAELGIIGLLLFFGICFSLLSNRGKYFFHKIFPTHTYVLFGCLTFAALNALKSGDLNDNILLFFLIGLISSRQVSSKRTSS